MQQKNLKAENKQKTRTTKTKEKVLLSSRFALPCPKEARRMQKKDSTLQL